MLLNVLTWALGGILMGALANGARWGIGAHRPDLPRPRLLTLGLGMVAGIIGGGISMFLFSSLFGLPAALAFGGAGVALGAWGLGRATPQHRTTGSSSRQGE
jgi:hypothetical protein